MEQRNRTLTVAPLSGAIPYNLGTTATWSFKWFPIFVRLVSKHFWIFCQRYHQCTQANAGSTAPSVSAADCASSAIAVAASGTTNGHGASAANATGNGTGSPTIPQQIPQAIPQQIPQGIQGMPVMPGMPQQMQPGMLLAVPYSMPIGMGMLPMVMSTTLGITLAWLNGNWSLSINMSIDAWCISGGLSDPFRFGTLNVGYVRGSSYLFSSAAGFGLARREQHTEYIQVL